MNFSVKQIASHVLPLAILSFCFITLRVSHHCPGEVEELHYGFPLGWLTPSLVSSMEYIVDLRALAIDFVVYLSVWSLLSLTSLFRKLCNWHALPISIGLWVMALAIGGLQVFVLTHTGYRGEVGFAPRPDCQEMVSYRLHFGPPGSRLP